MGYSSESGVALTVEKIFAGAVVDAAGSLPAGYTALRYIESTGTQYINLGISVPHASERIVVEFSPTEAIVDNVICGHAAPSWSWATNLAFVLDERIWVANTGFGGVPIIVGKFYTFEYTTTTAYIDGASQPLNSGSYTDGYNNTLFYASTKYGKHRVASYKLYNGSTLVRNLVPCKNPSNVVGMYDLVNGVFYGNAGSGAFVAGPVSVAWEVIKAYAGDENSNAQLIWPNEVPLEISYTGTYTDETVQMTDGTYRLLTLTGSGTLTFNQPTECDIWACSGGGGGYTVPGTGASAGGGGGGRVMNLFNQTVKSLIVTIGAGGAPSTNGGDVLIQGDVVKTVTGGNKSSANGGGDGGSGGGAGSAMGLPGAAGKGEGVTTRPFQDASLDPYGAGGGGQYPGASDGNDAITPGFNAAKDYSGGIVGGGRGAQIVSPLAKATSGTDIGAGGGGGGNKSGYYTGGSGYQGCVMVRIKLNDEGLVFITFEIAWEEFTAVQGMTWAEWVASQCNTGGFVVDGSRIETSSGSALYDFDTEEDIVATDVILPGIRCGY